MHERGHYPSTRNVATRDSSLQWARAGQTMEPTYERCRWPPGCGNLFLRRITWRPRLVQGDIYQGCRDVVPILRVLRDVLDDNGGQLGRGHSLGDAGGVWQKAGTREVGERVLHPGEV